MGQNPVKWFIENFGKEPEPKPPLIPEPYRIPFFLALGVLSFALLFALVNYVIAPAIRAQQSSAPSTVTTPAK